MASGASGSGHDSAAVAIAHPVGGKYVVDAMRERQPPFDPRQVLWEFAELAKRYNVIEASGDDWAKGFVSGGLSDFGLTYVKPPKLDKTAVYHELLYLVNSGQVEFLDDKRLMSQFVQLERKSGSTLKVDHPTGGHDDLANAVAGSIVMAAGVGTTKGNSPELMIKAMGIGDNFISMATGQQGGHPVWTGAGPSPWGGQNRARGWNAQMANSRR